MLNLELPSFYHRYYSYYNVIQLNLLCMTPKCPLNRSACSECHRAKWSLYLAEMPADVGAQNLLAIPCWLRWLHSGRSPSAPAPVRSYQPHREG